MKKIKDNIFWVIAGAAFIIFIGITISSNSEAGSSAKKPSNLNLTGMDAFAQCLTDSGAVFYGASWCSFCNQQKDMFGSAADLMPYVECAIPGVQGKQVAECESKNITGYPTWIFPDNSKQSGVVSLAQLSEKTGCSLP